MKRLWERTPIPCEPRQLDDASAAALQNAAQRAIEADSFGEARYGLRVESRRIARRSFFEWITGSPTQMTCHYFIFAEYFAGIIAEPGKPVFAYGRRLDDLEVRSYTSKVVIDDGVQLIDRDRSSRFLGLGAGAHAEAFEAALRASTKPL